MSWIEAAGGPEGVLAVFGGAAPTVRRVEVHSVMLGHDDVDVVFDLHDHPSTHQRNGQTKASTRYLRTSTIQIAPGHYGP